MTPSHQPLLKKNKSNGNCLKEQLDSCSVNTKDEAVLQREIRLSLLSTTLKLLNISMYLYFHHFIVLLPYMYLTPVKIIFTIYRLYHVTYLTLDLYIVSLFVFISLITDASHYKHHKLSVFSISCIYFMTVSVTLLMQILTKI